MKKLTILLIFIILIGCKSVSLFTEKNSVRLIPELDKLSKEYNIEIPDTSKWDNQRFLTNEGLYQQKYTFISNDKNLYLISIGKLDVDSVYIIKLNIVQ